MGRVLSGASMGAAGAMLLASNGLPLLPGQLPLFGTGRALTFYPGSGVVDFIPTTVRHRIRVLGGGASGVLDGQSSSFAALISATGGKKSNGLIGGAGGVGIGGDFQASGGAGGAGVDDGDPKRAGGGGGSAGSQMGAGGAGGSGWIKDGQTGAGGGGGAVGGRKGANGSNAGGGFGSSPFGFGTSDAPGTNLFGLYGPISGGPVELPFFAFTGGGAYGSTAAGSGAGGTGGNRTISNSSTISGMAGVMGGGSGGAGRTHESTGESSPGLFGGGQGGSMSFGGLGGCGGGGFAMGEFDLVVGQPYPVTVAQRIQSLPWAVTSAGLVIVEW